MDDVLRNDLMDRIDQIVQEQSLLKHPFYQAWTEGTLPFESLKGYAAEYYHFEAAYPTFLSGLHYRCSDRRVRHLLLENLWDEEHGPDNHVELWLMYDYAGQDEGWRKSMRLMSEEVMPQVAELTGDQ